MQIIIRNKGREFYPHWNRAIAAQPIWIGTAQQYDRELKSRGLQQAEPGDIEHAPKSKPYVASKEARQLIGSIKQQSKGQTFEPSGALKEKLVRKGVLRKKSEVAAMTQASRTLSAINTSKGGFF